ncbi:MAG: hypothetical protein M0Z40_13405 [Actinomycetota bacterium]|jgi:hypothetical protein|nr:hypothetical protein [Actinomycetota bacterium]MDA8076202.1 hypothetical protein [Actinomycetota bacterium]
MPAISQLTSRVTEILPLLATREVHARLEAEQVHGRVPLNP